MVDPFGIIVILGLIAMIGWFAKESIKDTFDLCNNIYIFGWSFVNAVLVLVEIPLTIAVIVLWTFLWYVFGGLILGFLGLI